MINKLCETTRVVGFIYLYFTAHLYQSTKQIFSRNILQWFTVTAIGARDVMVIVVGNGHGDTSSNPGQD